MQTWPHIPHGCAALFAYTFLEACLKMQPLFRSLTVKLFAESGLTWGAIGALCTVFPLSPPFHTTVPLWIDKFCADLTFFGLSWWDTCFSWAGDVDRLLLPAMKELPPEWREVFWGKWGKGEELENRRKRKRERERKQCYRVQLSLLQPAKLQ